jgi:hypothetical protein
MRYGLPGAAGLLFVVGLASTGLQVPSANAQGVTSAVVAAAYTTPAASTATERKKASSAGRVTSAGHSSSADSGKRYFIEFRSRNAESYGHMYVMYGVTNERHEIIKSEIAGFFPAGDGQHCLNCSVTNWTVGHVLPVPSEIGVSDGDLEEQYVTARFRVWLDAAQYRKVVSYVNERKAHRGPWNALFANCVTFGRDVAQALDLKMPFYMRTPSIVMYPKDVVESLREANGVHADQGPLKDAPGALPAEVAPHPELATQPEDTTAKSAPATSHSKKQLGDQRGEGQMAASAVH